MAVLAAGIMPGMGRQRISSPRLVGRTDELAALEALLHRAASGSGGAVLVAGEAGIGKSRLIAELETRARGAGALALAGECVELAEGELAFAPIVAALRPAFEGVDSVSWLQPPLRSALTALWPALGAPERSTGREQLFEAVYQVLARLAQRQLVVLIIEDVHWIDRSSRDLLAFLVRAARRDRLALVATYRPDELHRGHPLRPFLSELERSGRAERLELGALARAEIGQQLAAIVGRRPEPMVTERIFARCEGNPFFAEELLASANEAGQELPGSLREALLLRVEQLAPSTQAVLRVAATVGRSVDHRLLGSVVGSSEAELLAALREATEHHVLVLASGGMAYAFRHALLREAIYDDTFPGDRIGLHRAIAEKLSEHPEFAVAGASAELAHHWHAAGDLGAALAATVQAGLEAERMHAHGESLRHLSRALELWNRVADPEALAGTGRVELLLRASQIADWAGDADRELEYAQAAREEVDERAEPLSAAAAETRIGRALWNAGRGDDAVGHLAEARRLVPAEPPSVERAEALAAEGRALMLTGGFSEARRRLEEALAIARALGTRLVEASALNSLAIVYGQFGDRERAIDAGREGLRIAHQLDSAAEMGRAYVNGSQALDDAGRIQEALEMGLEGISVARRMGVDRHSGDQLRVQAAWRLSRMGRLKEAEEVLAPALEAATTPFNVAATTGLAGYLATERGDLDAGERQLEEAWALVQRSGGFQLIGPQLAWLVSLRLWKGELQRARALAHEGLERAAGAEGELIYTAALYWLAVRIEADLAERARALGDESQIARARKAATEALAQLDATIRGVRGDGAPPESLAFQALASAELTRLEAVHDPDPWRVAADRFEGLGEFSRVAYADFRAAEALAVSGAPRARVAERLRAAHSIAASFGLVLFGEQVEALARRAHVGLESVGEAGRPADAGVDPAAQLGLTDRELEVTRLLAEGRTNRQIGEELFITAKTASVHVSHILTKLGAANRAEATAAAHRLGLAREHAGPGSGAGS
jgi:DNA-binding CsgD family transcriptional regulator/tetratricopeptide (TPR) repeat protein